MAKKFINGENLVYAFDLFKQQIKEMIDQITDIIPASYTDIDNEVFK